ncbi:DUF805 domain-containing protein [Caulobacter sp. NIBR1757]|uniref:DUF805 domain-containing protein n=1 Tax=Caulobacter sp. NIBR1757 TaxID=3016000 RepID=UPI0022F0BD65|nr:DUF805 domain-containing protein [Caulobacter sp. NIBR1757]WGM40621.1 hypothetical protein AMEJIAPC_03566 [Caulobacter sp. NIBR1757]
MSLGNLLFSPFGRIGRSQFWGAWLGLVAFGAVFGWIPLVGPAVAVVAFYVMVCLFSKRLHDMGRSGWWQLVPIIAAPLLLIAGFYSLQGATLVPVGETGLDVRGGVGEWPLFLGILLSMVVGPLFFLWAGLTPGRTGSTEAGLPQGA